MKISFSTPLEYVDGSAIPADQLAAAVYTLFVDTVNPPAKSYVVPVSAVAAATKNADGSLQVTVDAAGDLKIALVPKTTYYLEVEDTISGNTSAETGPLTYLYEPVPNAPGNFSVA